LIAIHIRREFRLTSFIHFSLLVLLLALISSSRADAFCPLNGSWRCGLGLSGRTHEDITRDAVKGLYNEFFGTTNQTTSMKQALTTIAQSGAQLDFGEVHASFQHFDAESFVSSQQWIQAQKTNVKLMLEANSVSAARQSLGYALHTLQDFYSHTNWIENRNSAPNFDVGTGAAILGTATPTESTCNSCTPCLLGCQSNLTVSALTSGYFGSEPDTPLPGVVKCRHGGEIDSGPGPGGGINKDVNSCLFSPHYTLHESAAAVAVLATEKFLRELKLLLTDAQLRLLFGIGPPLVMVIDTTGSMADIIGQVQDEAVQIVENRLGTDQEPLQYVLAPFNDPFTGPVTVTDDPAVFEDAIQGLTADGGGDCPELSMTGVLQGIAAAEDGADVFSFTDADAKDADLAPTVSDLAAKRNDKLFPFVFGSCSSMFGGIGSPTPNATGQSASSTQASRGRTDWRKRVSRNLSRTAVAGINGDPAYAQIASATGGQEFFLERGEAGVITGLADAAVRTSAVDILAVADSLSGTSQSFSVPIDSTLGIVTFSASGASAVTIRRPNGSTLQETDPNVTVLAVSGGTVYTVKSPPVGLWTATLNGNQLFSLNVSGESLLGLDAFRFVEPAGRPGHQGLFPLEGLPVAGSTATAAVDLAGPAATVAFDLRTRAGAPISTLTLAPDQTGSPGQFFGPVTLPTTPFVVYATGLDTTGAPYQRVIAKEIQSTTVRVFPPSPQNLQAGLTTSYQFQVENFGPTDSFAITAMDDQAFVSSVSPATMSLQKNQTAMVTVELNVPSVVAKSLLDTLTVRAVSTSQDTLQNFAVVESALLVAPPLDCSTALPTASLLEKKNNVMVPVSVANVAGASGVTITGVTQNEPTAGAGAGSTCPDATGVGTATVFLRPERTSAGARLYQLAFSAVGQGLNCNGSVTVCVPRADGDCAGAAATFDSTVCH
jgi:hypothetical protein